MSWLLGLWRRFTCDHEWKSVVGEAGGYIHPRRGLYRPLLLIECKKCERRELRSLFVDDLEAVAIEEQEQP